jgi:hypothetical protein
MAFDKSYGNKLGKNSLGDVAQKLTPELGRSLKTKEDVLNAFQQEHDNIVNHGTSEDAYKNCISKITGFKSFDKVMFYVCNLALGKDGLWSNLD